MSNTRDLTGLSKEQIELVDGLIADLRDGPEVDYEEVGTLLIDIEGGEGSFDLDMDSLGWRGMGRIGQLDVLKDWAGLFQELYETTLAKRESEVGNEISYDPSERIHDASREPSS